MPYHLSDNTKKGCLYLLKHDPEFFSEILPLIQEEYFEFPAYKFIYTGIKQYFEKYSKIPSDAVIPDFILNNLEGAGEAGIEFGAVIGEINSIDKSCLEDREFILDTIEKFAKHRSMELAVRKSMAILNEEGDIAQVEELVRDALLVNRNVDVGQDYFEDVNARIMRSYDNKDKNRFKTVYGTHDRHLEGGLCRKELAMVVAPPGVGKSLYLVNQSAVSLLQGFNVLYISCEMSQDKVAGRFDSIITEIKSDNLKKALGQLQLKSKLAEFASHTPGRLIIKEFPTGLANTNTIRAYLTQLKLHKKFAPDLVVVDYLELLRPNRIIESEYMAQQRIAEELRGLAMEHNVLLWTASQTNREARKVNIITDAHLGDSYGKIRPCDWAISLNQKQEEYEEGAMRVYVVKARDAKQHYLINSTVDYNTLQMREPSCEQQSTNAD